MGTPSRVVIVTGLAGSGKSSAVKIFEDLGFYCVDNLPVKLLPAFVELSGKSEKSFPLVICVDVREPHFVGEFPGVHRRLRRMGPVHLIFFEASRKILVRRFSETRRRHPLAVGVPLAAGIDREVELMGPIRRLADQVIDTSDLTIHDLRKRLADRYSMPEGTARMTVGITSFGFKHGLPMEADMVFDVRFLPNPHFVDELRRFTGRNARVKRFVIDSPDTGRFLDHLVSMLRFLLPLYEREGKSYLTIGIGCTGGRHRSVTLAEELAARLRPTGYAVGVTHRDIRKGER